MHDSPWRISWLAGLLVGGLLACTAASASDPDRDALRSTIQLWAFAVNSQDVPRLIETMTEDVELSDGTSTVAGRGAAIESLRESVSRGRLLTSTREIAVAEDIGWHVAWLAQAQKNGDVHARGQALEIWKRVNGVWKLHRRMVSDSRDSGELLKRPSTREPVLDSTPQ